MGFNKKFLSTGGIVASSPSGASGTDNFAPFLYTGTGSSAATTFTGVGFDPDMVWVKNRDSSGENHGLGDTVRGGGYLLYPNLALAQATSDYIRPTTDGFIITTGNNNISNHNYVAWCWKAGGAGSTYNIDNTGYSTASSAGLDGGDINPTGASINKAAGFGIYTASPTTATQSISHGLNSAPEMYIFKRTDAPRDWYVSVNVGGTWKFGVLNGTGALNTTTAYTADANTMVIGGGSSVDEVIYAFHSVDGYQKVGSYAGNGTNQTIDVGFTPRFVMIKAYTTSSAYTSWAIFDSERLVSYDDTNPLWANQSAAEGTRGNGSGDGDVLEIIFVTDTGFKLGDASRNNASDELNDASNDYIYLAIA